MEKSKDISVDEIIKLWDEHRAELKVKHKEKQKKSMVYATTIAILLIIGIVIIFI